MVMRADEISNLTSFHPVMPHWLQRQAAIRGERLAVRCGSLELTFRELNDSAQEIAGRLHVAGVQAGDRIAVLMVNGIEFVSLVHAVAYLGAILVPLNYRLAPDELAYQIDDVGSRMLLCDGTTAAKARETAAKVQGPLRVLTVCSPESACDQAVPLESLHSLPPQEAPLRSHIDLAAVHSILYTSGTTGRPKGVMLTYGNHWWSAMASVMNLRLHRDDVWLACLPFFHAGGLAILMRSVICGMAVEIHPRFDPDAVNAAMDAGRVSLVSLVSTMLEKIIEARAGKPFPPQLRAILLGGGPVSPSLRRQYIEMGAPVVTSYGMTETASHIVAVPLEHAPDPDGAAGKPLFPAEVRIGSPEQNIAPGEVGEIWVRGPMVTPGYWGQGDEARADGWFATGDFGYFDAAGRLFVVDRRDDLIISGGENVYPAEVEAVIAAHPAVAEVAVVAAPSRRWGQVPVAFVVPRDAGDLDTAALESYCRERLAGYKVPVRFYRADRLPRTATGKVIRRQLAARLSGAPIEDQPY